jgi:hypothetical protein
MRVSATVRILSVAMLAAFTAVALHAADEAPASFVSLKFEGACDAKNNHLWLNNKHTFKTVAVTVRWRADGGKDLTEQFFPTPNSEREIGCAADAEIIDAKFADF